MLLPLLLQRRQGLRHGLRLLLAPGREQQHGISQQLPGLPAAWKGEQKLLWHQRICGQLLLLQAPPLL